MRMMRLATYIFVLTIVALCAAVVPMAAAGGVQSQRQRVIRAVDNKATLRSGVSIELVGLTYIPVKGQPWWKPDGSPVDEPPFDRVGTDPSVDPNWEQFNYYAVAMRLKGKAVDKLGQAKWLFRRADGHARTTYYHKNVLAGWVRFPKYVKTTTLRLGIAGGDWQTLIAFEDYGSYRRGKDSIAVSKPYGHLGPLGSGLGEKGLYVRVVYNVTDRDVRIVAVDKNGKVHLSSSGGSGGTSELRRTIANFRDLTQDKLREYRFEVRGYEWVEFRNIALRPGKEAIARAERKRAIEQEKLEQWLGEGQTRRIREQIFTLRESYHIHEPCNSQVAAISAIQELVRIGAPAVPELVTELRQTERWLSKSLIAFTLRAIGDRRAVPALIEVLGRSKYRGGYGVYVKDDELASFMLEHQHRPPDDGDRKAKQIIIAGPVVEIVKALEKITGHSEGPEMFSPETAEAVKRRWQRWWQQQNKQKTDVRVEVEKRLPMRELPKEAKSVMLTFQQTLKEFNWDRVLSYCSKKVKTKAAEYGSIEIFFTDVLPIEEIISLPEFRVSGRTTRNDKVTSYRCSIELKNPNSKYPLDWDLSVRREDSNWVVELPTKPLDIWLKHETLKMRHANGELKFDKEKIREGFDVRLVPLSTDFVIGSPMLFRLKMKNISNETLGYLKRPAMVNNPMAVKYSDGDIVPYMVGSAQVAVGPEFVEPNETIVLADNYDIRSQYHIVKPGRYTFQFKGKGYINPSNIVGINVKSGQLSPLEVVVEKLVSVLPKDWTLTRTRVRDIADFDSETDRGMFVHMVGKRARKRTSGGAVGVFILINPTQSVLEKTEFEAEFWGQSQWGPVYVKAVDAELLWPNYKEQIINTLNIQMPNKKPDVQVEDPVKTALGWLKLVDDGDYGKSFDEMAALYRGAVSKADWEKTMDLYGKGFGKAVSRKVSSKRHTRYLPTGPAGEYVIIEFESSFEHTSKASETVTLMRDKDGVWRVTNYFIQ